MIATNGRKNYHGSPLIPSYFLILAFINFLILALIWLLLKLPIWVRNTCSSHFSQVQPPSPELVMPYDT